MVALSARKQAINGKKLYFDMSFVLSVSIYLVSLHSYNKQITLASHEVIS